MANPSSDSVFDQAQRGNSQLLPGSITGKEFGKIYLQHQGDQTLVEFTIWMEDEHEGWQTGVALDASASMKDWFGRNMRGSLPAEVMQEYVRNGWMLDRVEDGRKVRSLKKEAYEDAIRRSYLTFTENILEPLAREFIGYLAGELDADGGTTVIYWACGTGAEYEVLGDFTEEQCKTLEVQGPNKVTFGAGTRLAPAIRYFVERFVDAERGLYVFLTDGKLDDLEEVKLLTTSLAREIEAGRRKPVKCVLIGIGTEIDESQMEELDDLDTGTEVDIWDHKIAKEMRAISEIIVELVDDNRIVAPTATVRDASGQVVKRFTDGLPARASFAMASTSSYFELEVGGKVIRQAVVTD